MLPLPGFGWFRVAAFLPAEQVCLLATVPQLAAVLRGWGLSPVIRLGAPARPPPRETERSEVSADADESTPRLPPSDAARLAVKWLPTLRGVRRLELGDPHCHLLSSAAVCELLAENCKTLETLLVADSRPWRAHLLQGWATVEVNGGVLAEVASPPPAEEQPPGRRPNAAPRPMAFPRLRQLQLSGRGSARWLFLLAGCAALGRSKKSGGETGTVLTTVRTLGGAGLPAPCPVLQQVSLDLVDVVVVSKPLELVALAAAVGAFFRGAKGNVRKVDTRLLWEIQVERSQRSPPAGGGQPGRQLVPVFGDESANLAAVVNSQIVHALHEPKRSLWESFMRMDDWRVSAVDRQQAT